CGYPRPAAVQIECWSVRLSSTCGTDRMLGRCGYPRLAVQIECWSVRLSPTCGTDEMQGVRLSSTCGTDRMLERAAILDLRYR
ncbi:hypothetical protein RRG08_000822, partial [Elysia crispata]